MSGAPLTLAEAAEEAGGAIAVTGFLVYLLVLIAAFWRMYRKAGQPGWAAIVPLYNLVVLCRIGGKPGWWAVLYFIPVVNLVVEILVWVGIAQRFGRGPYFSLGLVFFFFIFVPVLAFGGYEYAYASSAASSHSAYSAAISSPSASNSRLSDSARRRSPPSE